MESDDQQQGGDDTSTSSYSVSDLAAELDKLGLTLGRSRGDWTPEIGGSAAPSRKTPCRERTMTGYGMTWKSCSSRTLPTPRRPSRRPAVKAGSKRLRRALTHQQPAIFTTLLAERGKSEDDINVLSKSFTAAAFVKDGAIDTDGIRTTIDLLAPQKRETWPDMGQGNRSNSAGTQSSVSAGRAAYAAEHQK